MKFYLQPADDFDRALSMAMPGDEINLGEGTHYTKGNWFQTRTYGYGINGVTITAVPGLRATLALRDPFMEPGGVFRPDRDVHILRLGAGCSIENIDLDCSLPEFPSYRTNGLRFHGKYSVRNCTIKGLRGSREDNVEVFASTAQGDTGGSEVAYVKVYDCKPNSYVSGIYLGGTVPTKIPSKATNCDVQLGGGNMFCYSSNYYGQFLNCKGDGAEAFYHNDYGPTTGAVLRGCSGSSSEAAIRLIGTDKTIRELYASACTFKSKRGLVLWQHNAAPMTGAVAIVGCEIEAEYAACMVSPLASAVFANCTFTAGAVCQYRKGTQPPAFISEAGQQNIKMEET